MTSTLLLTGGAGFIGSALAHKIASSRPDLRVLNLDALTYAASLDNLAGLEHHPRHQFIHGDINDRPLLDRLLSRCDAVLHLAAQTHVDRSIADSAPFLRTNTQGTQTLLDAARASGRPIVLVLAGTDEVYGPTNAGSTPPDESAPLRPSSPYAASKAAADLLALAAHTTFGLDARIARSSNTMGPRQFPEKIVPLFSLNLLERRPVPLYGDGLHSRDWLHVLDHADALLALLDHGRPGRVYNVASGVETTNLDLTHQLLALAGLDHSFIRHAPDRPGHDRRYAMDTGRIAAELGWRPRHSAWPDMLIDTFAWYAANIDWARRAVARAPALTPALTPASNPASNPAQPPTPATPRADELT